MSNKQAKFYHSAPFMLGLIVIGSCLITVLTDKAFKVDLRTHRNMIVHAIVCRKTETGEKVYDVVLWEEEKKKIFQVVNKETSTPPTYCERIECDEQQVVLYQTGDRYTAIYDDNGKLIALRH